MNSNQQEPKSAQKYADLTNRLQLKLQNVQNVDKHLDDLLLNDLGLGGTKAGKSCRSRQELSNEYADYVLAKIGFD